jgi:hypothetical protein
MNVELPVGSSSADCGMAIPKQLWPALVPVAKRVFWWGKPEEWMENAHRFTAQVMVFGDWDDTTLTWKLLGDPWFRQVLAHAPPGVFDLKSWAYWHHHYQMKVPPLPRRF